MHTSIVLCAVGTASKARGRENSRAAKRENGRTRDSGITSKLLLYCSTALNNSALPGCLQDGAAEQGHMGGLNSGRYQAAVVRRKLSRCGEGQCIRLSSRSHR